MIIFKGFSVMWSESHVHTFSSFCVIEEQKKNLDYICIDIEVGSWPPSNTASIALFIMNFHNF